MKYFVLLCLFFAVTFAHAQTAQNELPRMNISKEDLPLRQHKLRLSQAEYANAPAAKTTNSGPGYNFDSSRWAHLVDSTWGAGLPDAQKMAQFNTFWKHFDSFYACYINLPAYNWDSIVTAIDTQIMHGVSKGRFAAIANDFMRKINDGHSGFHDAAVNYPSSIYRGLPLFRDESGKFGACITTFNDTEAMVYSVHAGHPLGLERGDIILGYNSEPWLKIVKTMLNNQLPNSVYLGSTDAATMHRYVQAAGENWYLFDTINIKKCDGSIVNLPTTLMTGFSYQDFPTEQMPVAGVNIPTYTQYYSSGVNISANVIHGHRIGYVYMYDCTDATGNKLLNATKRLVEDSLVTGLIYDIRTNFGGGFLAFESTFKYLNDADVSWVGYGDRYDANRLNLSNVGLTSWYDLTDDEPHYFYHPIAILTGPNAVSAGDFFPVLFRHHPNVKVFGKSTAGAYGSSTSITLPYTGFYASMQLANFFQTGAPTSYMTHTEVPVDSNIWFVRDSVCLGIDNMVSTAVQWIEGITSDIHGPSLQSFTAHVYPNPVSNYINIAITNPANQQVEITLRNMLGSVVLHTGYNAGSGTLRLDLPEQLPSGNYYLSLQDEKGNKAMKKIAVIR